MEVLQQIKNKTYDQAIPLLCIYISEEMKSLSERDICIPMVIVELFTIAKTRTTSVFIDR